MIFLIRTFLITFYVKSSMAAYAAADDAQRNENAITQASEEKYPKPYYKFGYSVFDPYTLDVKSQWEHRDGDLVKGAYNLLDPDGYMRIVEYIADNDNGFRAHVQKIPYNFVKRERLSPSEIKQSPKHPASLLKANVKPEGIIYGSKRTAHKVKDEGSLVQIPRQLQSAYKPYGPIPREDAFSNPYDESFGQVSKDDNSARGEEESFDYSFAGQNPHQDDPAMRDFIQYYNQYLSRLESPKQHLQQTIKTATINPYQKEEEPNISRQTQQSRYSQEEPQVYDAALHHQQQQQQQQQQQKQQKQQLVYSQNQLLQQYYKKPNGLLLGWKTTDTMR